MPGLLVVGEDQLCCVLAKRIVHHVLPGWELAGPPINTRGVTNLRKSLPRYAEQARHVQPVLCLADTDGECAVDWLEQWRPLDASPAFILRLAAPEAESWVLADRTGFAGAMQVPLAKMPHKVDLLSDAKQQVLSLVGRSKKRLLRTEMISATDPQKQGSGYNLHLCEFVQTQWNPSRASELSPSLNRAIRHVSSLSTSAG